MKYLFHIVFFIVVVWLNPTATAQEVYAIPDPAFRAYLHTNYPFLLNSNKELIISSANDFNGTLSCTDLGIQDLSGLEYFTSVVQINCSKNPLGTFPPLNTLQGLTHLWAEECDLVELPDLSQLGNLQVLDIKSNNISVLPDLSGLVSLKYFDCSFNKIRTIPDLSALLNLESFYCYKNVVESIASVPDSPNLKLFDCSFNKLKSIPDLSRNVNLIEVNLGMNAIEELPSFETLNNLERLYLYSNQLKQLPPLPVSNKLKLLNAADNNLTSIPDLSSRTELTLAAFDHNQISFSDIIPQVAHPSFASVFIFQPQDTINSFTPVNALLGSDVELSAKRDAQITSNTYLWKRDNSYFDTTSVNVLLLESVQKDQEGRYVVEVVNATPGLEAIRLVMKTVELSVSVCGTQSASYSYGIVSNTCTEGAVIAIEHTSAIPQNGPYKYQLVSRGERSLWHTSSRIDELKPGWYDLIVKDRNDCTTELKNFVQIPNASDCENVITPNGDGVADYYTILASGTVKIYDKSLRLVKELTGPGIWDGTNSNGEIVPIGLYIILINDKDKINVLVLN